MNWIQVLLIAAVLSLLVYLLRSRTNAKAKAWVKVGYVLFVVAAVYAILRPDDTTVLANWLGVARGADLLLYALVIAFLFTTLSTYLRFKDLEVRYARLARAVALQNPRIPERQPGRPRKYATVRATPSARPIRAGRPSSDSALRGSRQDRARSTEPRRGDDVDRWPSANSRSTRVEPMNPAASVTRARIAATIPAHRRGPPVQSWRCQFGRPRVRCPGRRGRGGADRAAPDGPCGTGLRRLLLLG